MIPTREIEEYVKRHPNTTVPMVMGRYWIPLENEPEVRTIVNAIKENQ